MSEIRTAFEQQCDKLDSKIESLSEWEKKFYLWDLLRSYYKPKLIEDREKYAGDSTTKSQINRLLNNVDEIDTLLCYEIF